MTSTTSTTGTTSTDQLTGTWVLDPAHTRIGFVARHAMVTKVRGSFADFEGSATIADDLAASSATLTAKVVSIDTGNAQRDGHLRTNDFFDADTFPEITFRSTAVRSTGEGTADVTGDLTIKGVTQPVTIPFELVGVSQDPYGNTRAGFEGSVTINRKDFGVTYNAALETGGVLIGEKVVLELDVSAIKQS